MYNLKSLKESSRYVRYEIIKQTFLKKSGHLGGSLSCVDILIYIFNRYIFNNTNNKFILSKGHCALSLYAVLHHAKKISQKILTVFHVRSYFVNIHHLK